MLLQEFRAFVEANRDLLFGVHPESPEKLDEYETLLGFKLSPSIRWLLSNHGYARATGIENLENSVEMTLECRNSFGLPNNIFIINDWNDGGVIYQICENAPDFEYPVVWGDAFDLHALAESREIQIGAEKFDNFPAWVSDCVTVERSQENQ